MPSHFKHTVLEPLTSRIINRNGRIVNNWWINYLVLLSLDGSIINNCDSVDNYEQYIKNGNNKRFDKPPLFLQGTSQSFI